MLTCFDRTLNLFPREVCGWKLKCPFPHNKSPVFLGQGFTDPQLGQGSNAELWLRGGLASWVWVSLPPRLPGGCQEGDLHLLQLTFCPRSQAQAGWAVLERQPGIYLSCAMAPGEGGGPWLGSTQWEVAL